MSSRQNAKRQWTRISAAGAGLAAAAGTMMAWSLMKRTEGHELEDQDDDRLEEDTWVDWIKRATRQAEEQSKEGTEAAAAAVGSRGGSSKANSGDWRGRGCGNTGGGAG